MWCAAQIVAQLVPTEVILASRIQRAREKLNKGSGKQHGYVKPVCGVRLQPLDRPVGARVKCGCNNVHGRCNTTLLSHIFPLWVAGAAAYRGSAALGESWARTCLEGRACTIYQLSCSAVIRMVQMDERPRRGALFEQTASLRAT